VKRLPVDTYRRQGRGGKGVRGASLKAEDVVSHVFTTTTHHWILVFTTKGRVYRVKVHEIPEGSRTSRGLFAANLPGVAVDGDERIAAVMDLKDYEPGRFLVFATKRGIVKKTALPEYASARTGLIAINLRDGDELIDVMLTDGKDDILLVSRKGQAIRFSEGAVRPMGRPAAGVIGMRLAEDDEVITLCRATDGEELISVTRGGYGKRTPMKAFPRKGRGGKGVIAAKLTSRTGLLAGAFAGTKDGDLFVFASTGDIIRASVSTIRRVGRPTQGVRTMRINDGEVVAISPVVAQAGEE
jgi:DNA gyrase subunit A